jgi:hypothetical protein
MGRARRRGLFAVDEMATRAVAGEASISGFLQRRSVRGTYLIDHRRQNGEGCFRGCLHRRCAFWISMRNPVPVAFDLFRSADEIRVDFPLEQIEDVVDPAELRRLRRFLQAAAPSNLDCSARRAACAWPFIHARHVDGKLYKYTV